MGVNKQATFSLTPVRLLVVVPVHHETMCLFTAFTDPDGKELVTKTVDCGDPRCEDSSSYNPNAGEEGAENALLINGAPDLHGHFDVLDFNHETRKKGNEEIKLLVRPRFSSLSCPAYRSIISVPTCSFTG